MSTIETKFYYRLFDKDGEKGLLSKLPSKALTYGFATREQQDGSSIDLFRYFSCAEAFINFTRQEYSPELRFFNEYIPGNQPQKPHFDIDIEVWDSTKVDDKGIPLPKPSFVVTYENIDSVANQTLDAFYKALDQTFLTLFRTSKRNELKFPSHDRDITTYESNSDLSGNMIAKKRSYHIIVNGFAWSDALDGKYFTKQLISRMSFGGQFVDMGVTSNNGFLRMVGSRKVKGLGIFSGLKRRMDTEYNFLRFPLCYEVTESDIKNDCRVPREHQDYTLLELKESLVTLIRDEAILPGFPRPEKKIHLDMYLDLEMVERVMGFLEDRYPHQYKLDTVKGNAIRLKSHFRSVCEMCDRIHESMEPSIFICRNGEARFYCGRRIGEKVFIVLGQINFATVSEDGDDDDENVKAMKRVSMTGPKQEMVAPTAFKSTIVYDPVVQSIESSITGRDTWDIINWGKAMLPMVKAYHTLLGSETMLTSHIAALKPFYTDFGYAPLSFKLWKARWDPLELRGCNSIEIPNYLFGNNIDLYTDMREVHLLMCRDLMRCLRIFSETTYEYICIVVRSNGTLKQQSIPKSYFTRPHFIFRHESEKVEKAPPSKDAKGNDKKEKDTPQPRHATAIFWGEVDAELLSIDRQVGVSVCNQIFEARVGDYRTIFPRLSDYEIDNAIRYGNGDNATVANDYIRNCLRNNSTPQLQTCLVDIFTIERSMVVLSVPERSPQYIQRFIEPAVTRNGFNPDPKKISWYVKFINKVCGGNEQAFLNVMNVIRFALITGEKPSKCIFLCGTSGAGKSAFCQMIRNIYGPLNSVSIEFDAILSNFNSWADSRLIVIEESAIGSRKAQNSGMLNKLKNLITNETTSIERKNQNKIEVENSALVMMCADKPEQLLDKGLIRRFISVSPNFDPTKYDDVKVKKMTGPKKLRHLVAYFASTPEEVEQWNRTLNFDEKLLPLNTIEEIRVMRDNLQDAQSEYGRGATVDERCWRAIEEGHLSFPYELCFKKSNSNKWKAGAGNIYVHPIGFHNMFHNLMTQGKCTPEQQYNMFATEAEKKRSESEPIVTNEMYAHNSRHTGKIQMRQLMDNWMSISVVNCRGFVETLRPGFKTFDFEKINPSTLRSYGNFDDTIRLIGKNERWYRLNKDWVDAYEQICTKPEDQVYPKFSYVDIDIGVKSKRANVEGSLHECIRTVEPKGSVQEASTSSEAEDTLWATPAARFEQQAAVQASDQSIPWWSQAKFIPTPAIISSAMNSSFYS